MTGNQSDFKMYISMVGFTHTCLFPMHVLPQTLGIRDACHVRFAIGPLLIILIVHIFSHNVLSIVPMKKHRERYNHILQIESEKETNRMWSVSRNGKRRELELKQMRCSS